MINLSQFVLICFLNCKRRDWRAGWHQGLQIPFNTCPYIRLLQKAIFLRFWGIWVHWVHPTFLVILLKHKKLVVGVCSVCRK